MAAPKVQTTSAPETPARLLVDRLADFLKTSGLYPANNQRVQAAADSLLAQAELLRGERRRVVVRLAKECLCVDAEEAESSRPNVAWLRESMRKTAVSAITLEATATRESLLLFGERLRRNTSAATRATTFAELWPEPFEGIAVLERLFLGGACSWQELPERTRNTIESNSPQGALLRHALETTDELTEQLLRLDSGAATSAEERASRLVGGLQLVHHIVDLLPTELVSDPQTGFEIVQMVLSAGAESLQRLQTMPEQQATLEFRRLILEVSSRYFGHGTLAETEAEEEVAGPKGHAGDELITDSLPELLAEIEALPRDPAPITAASFDSAAEKIGVCLHQLLHADGEQTPEGLRAHLAKILPRLDEPARELLASYFAHMCSPLAGEQVRSRLLVLLAMLRESGVGHLLSSNLLAPQTVAASFPATFGAFLDLLDPSRQEDCTLLEETCRLLGRDRVRRATETLVGKDGLLTAARAEKLFALRSPAIAPLALIILNGGDPAAVAQVARYLANLKIPGPEAEALRVVDPPDQLPRAYLQSLCEHLAAGQPAPAQLLRTSEELIRSFIAEPAASAEQIERQARAVAALRVFWSGRTRDFVRSLLRGTGLLRLRRRPKPVRAAARTLLQSCSH